MANNFDLARGRRLKQAADASWDAYNALLLEGDPSIRRRSCETAEVAFTEWEKWLSENGEALLGVAESVGSFTSALRDVVAERRRQVEGEGWSAAHDDAHTAGELAQAGACYLLYSSTQTPAFWPWSPAWWKPKGYRSNFVRAAALVLAELERIDRAAIKEGGSGNVD